MATYTTNLNLEKPATSENFDLLKINANWDKIDSYAGTVNSNIEKVKNADFTISLTSGSGRTESVACGIAGYVPIGATFLQNDDLYYLTVTDGIYPNLSLVTGSSTPYVQILGMNKTLGSVGATRNIKIRVVYTKT